ncbi:MAG: PmoA family protein [bacterium]
MNHKHLYHIFIFLALMIDTSPILAQVSFQEHEDRVDVLMGGKLFTTFHYGKEWDKPFLHPIIRLDGTIVTRGYPLEPLEGDSQDHPFHRGLWYAHGDINGVDFWREATEERGNYPLPLGTIEVQTKPQTSTRQGRGTLSAAGHLITHEGQDIGTFLEQFTFSQEEENQIIDIQISILANQGKSLNMGDTEEGCLGFRFREEFRQDRGAVLSNAKGQRGTEKIWGKRANWVDYSTTVDGNKTGVAFFDHPDNPNHPTYWHARGYGLCAANPFGIRHFLNDPNRDGSLTIPPYEQLIFRYRVLIHPGDSEEAGIEELYQKYLK